MERRECETFDGMKNRPQFIDLQIFPDFTSLLINLDVETSSCSWDRCLLIVDNDRA